MTGFARPDGTRVPAVTAAQMREVDRAMTGDFHIELPQMMENAGRNLADLAGTLFAPPAAVILAGPGGNGGGGLVAARHLRSRGVGVSVVVSSGQPAPVTAHQLDIVHRMGIPVLDQPAPAGLVVDALLGYGLRGDPASRPAALITWANGQPAPVLALDTPSGLDVTTGRQGTPCIRATATMTLALPKTGLAAAAVTGTLYLADISVPGLLLERMGSTAPGLFGDGPVIRLLDWPGTAPAGPAR